MQDANTLILLPFSGAQWTWPDLLLARPRLQQQTLAMAPASTMMQTPAPVAPAAYADQSDLDRTLATLAAALAADL